MTFLLRYWPQILGVVLLIAIGFRLGGMGPRAELAEAKAEHSRQVAEWQRMSADAAAKALKKQTALQLDVDTAREDLHDALAKIADQDARIARLNLDAGKLRSDLAAFASGSGGSDSVAACQTRARSLADLVAEGGGLLGTCAGLFRESAIAHDERAAEVAALLKAWPKSHAEDN